MKSLVKEALDIALEQKDARPSQGRENTTKVISVTTHSHLFDHILHKL